MNCYSKSFTSEKKANKFANHLEKCGLEVHEISAARDGFGQNTYRVMWFADKPFTALVWVD